MEALLADLLLYAQKGGFVMPPLMLATVVLWFCIGYRYTNLKRGNRRSVRVMIDRARRGELKEPSGVLDNAVLMGLAETRRPHDALRPYLDDLIAPFDRQITQFKSLISSIVAVAPLLGLLGTVIGMIETFNSLGDMSLFSQSGGIAGGISQALFTTQMGLAVAIPGLMMKGFLDRREDEIELELAQLKDILCAQEDEKAA